jgi:hypothetical protein
MERTQYYIIVTDFLCIKLPDKHPVLRQIGANVDQRAQIHKNAASLNPGGLYGANRQRIDLLRKSASYFQHNAHEIIYKVRNLSKNSRGHPNPYIIDIKINRVLLSGHIEQSDG